MNFSNFYWTTLKMTALPLVVWAVNTEEYMLVVVAALMMFPYGSFSDALARHEQMEIQHIDAPRFQSPPENVTLYFDEPGSRAD